MSGVVAPHFTAFPTSIGLAATWDPAAVEEMADIIRRQMRAVGLLQALAPVMDVARDARWGRVSETYGEDPYLVSAMSVAYTRGLQGKDLSKGVLATAKHFLGYAVTEGGQNMAATAVGARALRRPCPSLRGRIRLAGLATVMPSYSEFDGVPISASRAVLTDMLRDGWASPGRPCPTTSPSDSCNAPAGRRTPEEAGRSPSRPAWTSRRRPSSATGRCWPRPCATGRYPSRSWTGPYAACCATSSPSACSTTRMSREPGRDPHRRERGRRPVRRLAAESVTLLKNEKGLLPLSRDIAKIAIIGPHADDVEAGFTTYTYPAGLKMMHARATGGDIAMAGVDLGGGAPPEAKAAVAAELAPVFKTDRRDYLKSNYSACPSPRRSASSCRRPRSPPSRAPVWFRPSRRTFRPRSPPPGMPTSSSSPSAADRHGPTTHRRRRLRHREQGPPPAAGGADQRRDRGRQADHRGHLDGRSVRPRFRDRQAAGGRHRLLRPHQGSRSPTPSSASRTPEETAVHAAAARGAGADPLRPEMGQRLPADQDDIHKGYLDMPSTPLAFGHG